MQRTGLDRQDRSQRGFTMNKHEGARTQEQEWARRQENRRQREMTRADSAARMAEWMPKAIANMRAGRSPNEGM
jgi:hypothetical protein